MTWAGINVYFSAGSIYNGATAENMAAALLTEYLKGKETNVGHLSA
jgi:hypothetical protein